MGDRVFSPIVAVAGLTMAGGTAALTVAKSDRFRAFGPGMALTVLIGAVGAVTLVPALLAIIGRGAFWPTRPAPVRDPGIGGAGCARFRTRRSRTGWMVLLTRPPVPAAVFALCTTALLLAALPVRHGVRRTSVAGADPDEVHPPALAAGRRARGSHPAAAAVRTAPAVPHSLGGQLVMLVGFLWGLVVIGSVAGTIGTYLVDESREPGPSAGEPGYGSTNADPESGRTV